MTPVAPSPAAKAHDFADGQDLARFMRSASAWLSMVLLCVGVALAPLPFGLTAPLPLASFCLLLGFAMVLSLWHGEGRIWPVGSIVLVAAGAYLAMALLQMSPRFAAKMGAVAPAWGDIEIIGIRSAGLVSWTKDGPWFALGPTLAIVLSVLASFSLAQDRSRAAVLLWTFALSGAAYAIYGIAAHAIDPRLVLWREKTAYLDSVTGPFINRNTAATYWGSCAIVWLQLGLNALDKGARRRRRLLLGCCCGLLVCAVALGMTGSRAGGLLSLFCGALTFGVWLVRSGRRSVAGAFALAAVVALVAAELFGGLIFGRASQYGFDDPRRAQAYLDTLRMIADHPFFGVGLGNFGVTFPLYRSGALGSTGLWDRLHNTPLELAVELGLPVTLIIIGCCCALLYRLLRGCLTRIRDGVYPLAGLGVGLLGGLHSCVDFSLQIAGYGIVFGSVVGCGLAQSMSTGRRRRSQPAVQVE